MTPHAIFLSLVDNGHYEKACDYWTAQLATATDDAATRFRDLRERLGDEAAALDVADAIATAAE